MSASTAATSLLDSISHNLNVRSSPPVNRNRPLVLSPLLAAVFALLRASLGILFAGFVRNRLLAEFPDADELMPYRIEDRSDAPRMGSGLRVSGVV